MFSNDDVYRVWINGSHGAAFGKTITLTSRNAHFLVSFLTLYVAIAGNRFWLIIAFLVHQEIANREKYDGIHIQQQVVLCNSDTPMSAAISLVKIAFRWRETAKRPLLRSLPLIALALSIPGVFYAASVLTGEVASRTGNETLIASSNCSYWQPALNNEFHQGGFRTKLTVDALAAVTYSRACYGPSTRTSTQCNTYIARQIPWNETTDPKCPFSSLNSVFSHLPAYTKWTPDLLTRITTSA